MSIEIISVGNFDYSNFNLSHSETLIISNMIKYDIYTYHVSKNLSTNNIEFIMNVSSLNHSQAEKLFSSIFDLLESDYAFKNISDFNLHVLQFKFHFLRKVEENTHYVSWDIKCDNIDKIKLKLFDYYHKNAFYNQLLTKFIPKDLKVKQLKI